MSEEGKLEQSVESKYAATSGTGNATVIVNPPREEKLPELDERSPYRGLRSFNVENHDLFFGRDALINDLLRAVEQSNLNLVLGASGSGKSSVVSAGLIDGWEKSLGHQTSCYFIFTPGKDPFESLYNCLCRTDKDYEFDKSKTKIALEAKADTLTQTIKTLKQDEEKWLIFVDQFEEVFTRCSEPDKRRNFIASLVKIAKSEDKSVKIVLAMRSDFLEQLLKQLKQFNFDKSLKDTEYSKNVHWIPDMNSDELREAIEKPAAKHGVKVEEGLVKRIIEDVKGQKGYLSILQHTLELLWKYEGKSGGIKDCTLNQKSYEELRGIGGILQEYISSKYAKLKPDGSAAQQIFESAARQIFMKLVESNNSGSGSKIANRQANQFEFVDESIKETLSQFVDANLVVISSKYSSLEQLRVSSNKYPTQSAIVEIAHEALLSSWDKLKGWLEEEREANNLKNRLANTTKQWLNIRQKNNSLADAELWDGSQLNEILKNISNFQRLGGLSPEEEEFINASVARRDRLLKQKERLRQIFLAASVVVAGLVTFAVTQWREVQIGEVNNALSRASALFALNQSFDDLKALLSSIEAGQELKQVFGLDAELRDQVRARLQQAVYRIQERDRIEQGKGRVVSGLSADGHQLANLEQYGFDCSWDNLICVWDKSGEQMTQFIGSESQSYLTQAVFSPDRSKLITVSSRIHPEGYIEDGSTVVLWDLKSNERLTEFVGHQGEVLSVSFNPDGDRLAIAGDDGISLWDLNGNQIPEFQGGQGRVTYVTFSLDGKQLASVIDSTSAEGYNNVRFWNLKGQPVGQLKGDLIVDEVIFSPDGKHVATTGTLYTPEYGTVRLWNLSGNQIGQLRGGFGNVIFSSDGSLIAGSGEDKVPRVWNLSGDQVLEFKGHRGRGSSEFFSPDANQFDGNQFNGNQLNGNQLVTVGGDNTIRLWDWSSKADAEFDVSREAFDIIFSPDGSLVATTDVSYEYDPNDPNPNQFPEIGRDNAISLWDLEGKNLGEIPTNQGNVGVKNVAISPDNQQLAIVEGNGVARLWNWRNKQQLEEFKEPEGSSLIGVSFSGDRSLLITQDEDNTIRLWNWNKEQIAQFKDSQEQVYTVLLSPDSSKIVTVGNEGLRLWNLEGEQISQVNITLNDEYAEPYRVILSRNNQLVAINSEKDGITVWNWDGKQITQFREGYAMDFSPDGSLLATNQNLTNVVRLLDLASGQQVAEYPTRASFAVRFSPNGQLLATVDNRGDSVPQLWRIESLDELMVRGCNWLQSYLKNNPSVSDSDRHLCDGIGR